MGQAATPWRQTGWLPPLQLRWTRPSRGRGAQGPPWSEEFPGEPWGLAPAYGSGRAGVSHGGGWGLVTNFSGVAPKGIAGPLGTCWSLKAFQPSNPHASQFLWDLLSLTRGDLPPWSSALRKLWRWWAGLGWGQLRFFKVVNITLCLPMGWLVPCLLPCSTETLLQPSKLEIYILCKMPILLVRVAFDKFPQISVSRESAG